MCGQIASYKLLDSTILKQACSASRRNMSLPSFVKKVKWKQNVGVSEMGSRLGELQAVAEFILPRQVAAFRRG